MTRLRVVPVELDEANAFVAALHRHHDEATGHRFSLGAVTADGRLVGVAIVGRPVARMVPKNRVIEVTRVCTDGTKNACSLLYGAAARAAKAIGFDSIQTYTLPEEGGASLRAAGWTNEGEAGGGAWEHTDGRPRSNEHPLDEKYRWRRTLNPPAPTWKLPEAVREAPPELFGDAA